MTLFLTTLNQMAYLFAFIAIGFILGKAKILPDNSARILSKLENTVFIPALVMGTFMKNFTVDRLSTTWKLLLFALVVQAVVIPLSILSARFCTKSPYLRKIYTYGLSFSNFAFMGNAVVSALFPDIFLEYLIFTLVLWTLIYLWGVPALLICDDEKKVSLKESLKSFVNPMFIGMLIGMVIGLTSLPVPGWLDSVITTSGNCMSPIAMLLTGITVAAIDLKATLKTKSIYTVSALRLIVFPLIGIGVFALIPQVPQSFVICAICSLAMPLGLNTIVIPSAYGKDTSAAAGMALVSHVLACLTIPFIFLLLMKIL